MANTVYGTYKMLENHGRGTTSLGERHVDREGMFNYEDKHPPGVRPLMRAAICNPFTRVYFHCTCTCTRRLGPHSAQVLVSHTAASVEKLS